MVVLATQLSIIVFVSQQILMLLIQWIPVISWQFETQFFTNKNASNNFFSKYNIIVVETCLLMQWNWKSVTSCLRFGLGCDFLFPSIWLKIGSKMMASKNWHFGLILSQIKADWPLTRYTLNTPWLLTNRQFQWTGNGHLQLPLAELGKPSPNIDLIRTTGLNGRAIFHCLTLTFDLWPTFPG